MASPPRFVMLGGAVPPGRGEEPSKPEVHPAPAELNVPVLHPRHPLPTVSPSMPHFLLGLQRIPYGESMLAAMPQEGFSRPPTLLEALASAPAGTTLPDLLLFEALGRGAPSDGVVPTAAQGGVHSGLLFAPRPVEIDGDELRIGGDNGVDWPGGGVGPTVPDEDRPEPGSTEPGGWTKTVHFFALLYCCYDITCDFTLDGKTIARHVDIKAAWRVVFESAANNPDKGIPHVIPKLSGSDLQKALNTHMASSDDVDWDDIEDITGELKPSASRGGDTGNPARDRARAKAKRFKKWKVAGGKQFIFKERRAKQRAKRQGERGGR